MKGQAGKAAAFSPERTGQLKPRGAARICGGNALAAAPKPRAPHERLLANRDPAHKMQHMDAATGAPALLTLPSGHEMPSLGLGTWRMGESRASHANELADEVTEELLMNRETILEFYVRDSEQKDNGLVANNVRLAFNVNR